MTRTLTTEQLNQIKADIAARKEMPEYGESVEGNIERLRVIGATRSHFSTETVEMLVRALEEKSRALADAERERDDWVEHSRRMEYRAIEAKELLANRETLPVGKAEITKIAAELVRGDYLSKLWTEAEKSRHVDTHRLQNLLDELHDVMKVKAIAITRLLTAPPAPAVPESVNGA